MRLLGPKFPLLAEEQSELFTQSSFEAFGERVVERDGVSYRHFDAKRSKLAALIRKGASQIGIRPGDTVLYLGAAHGYTPSFVSDIVGNRGVVFCVDFSPRVVRDLLALSMRRENMIPILADAKKPDEWSFRVTGADVVFQDVAQKEQVAIFLRNCDRFLKSGGFGLLSLKARSIDMTRNPKDLFKEVYTALEKSGEYKIVDYRELAPFERDHAFYVVKKA